MSKQLIFILALSTILITAILTYGYDTQFSKIPETTMGDEYKPGKDPEADSAINQSQQIYASKSLSQSDLSNGPCLTNALMKNWVLDLVHSPREPIDDLPENQCSAYLEGQVKHFVELDLEGNLVRFK